jgi:hypothetical protein
VRDIVGLYVDPPAHAVVLSVDEKRSHGDWIATVALAEWGRRTTHSGGNRANCS